MPTKTRKPRERRGDALVCRNHVTRIIRGVSIGHKSHAEMLDMRSELFARDEWKRLPGYVQSEFLGYMRGAELAWHATGAIVWTHTLDSGETVWIPKSVLDDDSEVYDEDKNSEGEVVVKTWWAEKEGLA